jgi:hypothetical protein
MTGQGSLREPCPQKPPPYEKPAGAITSAGPRLQTFSFDTRYKTAIRQCLGIGCDPVIALGAGAIIALVLLPA